MSTERPAKPISSRDLAWTEWSDIPRFTTRYQHLTRAVRGEDYRPGVSESAARAVKVTRTAFFRRPGK